MDMSHGHWSKTFAEHQRINNASCFYLLNAVDKLSAGHQLEIETGFVEYPLYKGWRPNLSFCCYVNLMRRCWHPVRFCFLKPLIFFCGFGSARLSFGSCERSPPSICFLFKEKLVCYMGVAKLMGVGVPFSNAFRVHRPPLGGCWYKLLAILGRRLPHSRATKWNHTTCICSFRLH